MTLLAYPVAGLVASRAGMPQMNAAEAAAKAAWLAKLETPSWGSSAKYYANLPASVQPGVLTGQAVTDLLEDAKNRGYAIPAVNCVTSSSVNACLEAAAKAQAPVMIQFVRWLAVLRWQGPRQHQLCGGGLRRRVWRLSRAQAGRAVRRARHPAHRPLRQEPPAVGRRTAR